jgi:hypothetical protein
VATKPGADLTSSDGTVIHRQGELWVDILAMARANGRTVSQHASGLTLIGDSPVDFSTWRETELDAVITQFDTPEKLADPDLATKYIPLLKLQGKWTDHVKVTSEQLKLLDQPEPDWPETPRDQYNLTGFNQTLLGSKTPPPGVYPRILFNTEDLPMLRERIKQNKLAQKSLAEVEALLKKTWLDPNTSDGQVFVKLAAGNTGGLLPVDENGKPKPGFCGTYKDQKPGIYNSHINYNGQCLATIALYALLTDNDELGQRAANAITTYCKLGEPAVDAHLATSDSEWGVDHNKASNSATHWRGMHGVVPHMDLPFLLDFGGKWMSAEQKDLLRRVIAKATYGRRTGGGDGPRRCWRDINHVTWHLTHGLAITAIEGLEGFDAEAYASHVELTRDFLEWGVDTFGQMYEGNGKSGGGIQFQILSMIALARRGDNLWGHPHWRKLLEGQVYATTPNGKATVSSGTWGGSAFSAQAVNEYKAFYPGNRCADYLLTNAFPSLDLTAFDTAAYPAKLAAPKGTDRMRLVTPSYPGFGFSLLYDTDWKVTEREELRLPLDWNDTVHGILSSSSDATPGAAWLCLHIRANHYMGSGHHHADVGLFYFSGLGVNWFTESPFIKNYDGKYHNEVLIDGIAEADGPTARGKYLGAKLAPGGVLGSADLTYAYTWRWCTQVMLWKDDWMTTKGTGERTWELETEPETLACYQGTQRYKMRPWWPTNLFSNWIPTLRAPFNPVQYVFRSTGLLRGAHPYGVVADDVKKDDQTRLYQWTGMLGTGVWQANVEGLPANQILLAYREPDPKKKPAPGAAAEPIAPENGAPVLLVCALGMTESGDASMPLMKVETATDGPDDGKGKTSTYDRLVVNRRASEAAYRVLLIPLKQDHAQPEITYDASSGKATIKWTNQTDVLTFTTGRDHRSTVRVERDGEVVVGIGD